MHDTSIDRCLRCYLSISSSKSDWWRCFTCPLSGWPVVAFGWIASSSSCNLRVNPDGWNSSWHASLKEQPLGNIPWHGPYWTIPLRCVTITYMEWKRQKSSFARTARRSRLGMLRRTPVTRRGCRRELWEMEFWPTNWTWECLVVFRL